MAEYVNGREMLAEVIIYKAACDLAEKENKELPQMSKKLAEAIVQIATRLGDTWNFRNYTYIDEMRSDAILQCMTKIRNFDPTITENIFAFSTQICWTSFITRIKIEQKQCSVKAKMIREKLSSEFIEHGVDADSDDGSNAFVEFLKSNDCLVDYFELKKESDKNQPIHNSLVHRNKTAYKKKEAAVEIAEVSLSDFEA